MEMQHRAIKVLTASKEKEVHGFWWHLYMLNRRMTRMENV